MTELAGRVAVVTGGASGIGLGIAQAFHDAGARIVIADLSLEQAEAAAESLDGLAVQTDVSDASSMQALAEATLAHYGEVDVLVNNAGVGPQAKLADMTLADWHWLLNVNLWGVIHGLDTFLPLISARPEGGHIVNVSSMSAFSPLSPLGGYAVTKAGVTALTEVLALELEQSGSAVHATVVAPGPVRTQIGQSLRNRPAQDVGSLREFNISPPDELWKEPREVGEIVLDAVRANALYAITHPQLWPRVAARNAGIAAAFGQQ